MGSRASSRVTVDATPDVPGTPRRIPCIVMNLAQRTDRLRSFRHSVSRAASRRISEVHVLHGEKHPIRWVGCRDVQVKALQYAAHKGWQTFLMCEDDCLFAQDVVERWDNAYVELPADWTALYLSVSSFCRDSNVTQLPSIYSRHLLRNDVECSGAYSVILNGASRIWVRACVRVCSVP